MAIRRRDGGMRGMLAAIPIRVPVDVLGALAGRLRRLALWRLGVVDFGHRGGESRRHSVDGADRTQDAQQEVAGAGFGDSEKSQQDWH